MAATSTQNELKDPNGKPILCPTLRHTGNYTTRIDEMLEWYRNVVGMEITLSPEALPGHFCSNDGMHHRMSFFHLPDMSPDVARDAAGVNHVAFEYETIDDLLETWERLQALEIVPHSMVDHGPTYSLYYWDPDGNNVELFTDAFGDWQVSKKFFIEDADFKRNPMGKEINPTLMIEARKRGMTPSEVHERALRGEFGPEAKPTWDGWDAVKD